VRLAHRNGNRFGRWANLKAEIADIGAVPGGTCVLCSRIVSHLSVGTARRVGERATVVV
jgi:hypothetical protein